jgi:transitional endoplasmic reticulum ATPase
VEFPDVLCEAIAGITDKFSFAYMQEAFVAALLAIARKTKNSEDDGELSWNTEDDWRNMEDDWIGVSLPNKDDKLDKYILWTQIKVQVKNLREGME